MHAAELAARARVAARRLAGTTAERKDRALIALAAGIREQAGAILEANREDVEAGRAAGVPAAMLDRLALDPRRLEAIARSVEAVALLADPVGEVTEVRRRPNGLRVERVRAPLGVVLAIYEARPNVTVDAAALCLKSGNACILRGGREALRSNLALAEVIAEALATAELVPDTVQVLDRPDRDLLLELLRRSGEIDLAIPRGGEGLIRFVEENARVPVIRHYRGVCHLYLDASAPAGRAAALAVDGKARPSACNATETLLVHAAAAEALLPEVGRALRAAGVELRAEARALEVLGRAGVDAVAARPDDFGREFLDRILAVRVVASLDEALEHIQTHGSLHTEAICTEDLGAAARFEREVDASCVLVNASTRFNDGGELGLGAEIGISTSKLHAYGPMGLRELTTTRFVVLGEGQVRG